MRPHRWTFAGLLLLVSTAAAGETVSTCRTLERGFELEPTVARSEQEGRWRLRADRWTGVRVAAGGPQLSFETLDGDVLVRRTELP